MKDAFEVFCARGTGEKEGVAAQTCGTCGACGSARRAASKTEARLQQQQPAAVGGVLVVWQQQENAVFGLSETGLCSSSGCGALKRKSKGRARGRRRGARRAPLPQPPAANRWQSTSSGPSGAADWRRARACMTRPTSRSSCSSVSVTGFMKRSVFELGCACRGKARRGVRAGKRAGTGGGQGG